MLQQNAVLTFTAKCSRISKTTHFNKGFFILKRKCFFIVLNIVLPLLTGLTIYLFCYKNTYINTIFEDVFNISLPYLYFNNLFHHFLTCWACDILWAYSLSFSLFACFNNFKNSLILTVTISTLFSIIIEVSQWFAIIKGTFDIWDIILELTAIIFAVIIIKKGVFK